MKSYPTRIEGSRLSSRPHLTPKPPSVVHHLTQLACKQEVEPFSLLPSLGQMPPSSPSPTPPPGRPRPPAALP